MNDYFLGTMLSPRSVPIDEARFVALKQASHGVWTTLVIEERFVVFAENYRELDADCARLAQSEQTKPDFAAFPVHEIVQLLNRRLGNVLASAKGFTQQIEKSTRKVFGESTLKVMKAFMSARYDASLAYRFMCALRNYAQHAGFPVSEVGFKYIRLENDERNVSFRYTLDLNMVRRSPDPIKAKTMEELAQLGQRLELTPMIAEYVRELHAVLLEFRRLTSDSTGAWRDYLLAAIEAHDARHAFAFAGSRQVERVSLLTSGIGRLEELRQRHYFIAP